MTRAKPFRNFHELLAYAQPSSGAELAFNHYATQQILRNSRMLRKPFFEMRIKIDPLTGDTALLVTDYAEKDEIEEATLLWEKQLGDLKRVLGG